jgi:hypothetical protein
VSAGRKAKGWLEVRVAPSIWAEEVERLRPGSPGRVAAERERKRLERDGLPLAHLLRCDDVGADRTRLASQFKVYVPVTSGPASERPFGFVLSLGVNGDEHFLSIVSFGARHPERGSRSVYERAHKRLHGRYPDQERTRPEDTGLTRQARSPSRGMQRGRDRGGLEL